MINIHRLARAVVMRAYWDLQTKDRRCRAEAVQFLTAGGEWEESRTAWCHFANIDPIYVQRRAELFLLDGALLGEVPSA